MYVNAVIFGETGFGSTKGESSLQHLNRGVRRKLCVISDMIRVSNKKAMKQEYGIR